MSNAERSLSPASSAQTNKRLTQVSSHLSSTKPKIVVTRSLGPEVMPLLDGRTDIEVRMWPEDSQCDRAWLLENVKGAVGVVCLSTDKVDVELLDAAGASLRVVSTMSVGYEHFDVKEIKKRGVRMGYTPDVLTDAVADVAVMLALMAGRNVGETYSLVQAGSWPSFHWSPFAFCGPQISTTLSSPSRTVGFLGFGRIAQATLKRLVAFGVTKCIYSSRTSSSPSAAQEKRDRAVEKEFTSLTGGVKPVSMDELASQSDVVIVLAPGGPETHHLISTSFLRQMRPHAILVNAGRGSVVDSDALATALKEKWIWGAGLDVVEGEPNVGKGHPLVGVERCVVLPHVGSATVETRRDMATLAVRNVLGGLGVEGVEGMGAEITE